MIPLSCSINLHCHTGSDPVGTNLTFNMSEPFLITKQTGSSVNSSPAAAFHFLSFNVELHIHLNICTSVLSNFTSCLIFIFHVSLHHCHVSDSSLTFMTILSQLMPVKHSWNFLHAALTFAITAESHPQYASSTSPM